MRKLPSANESPDAASALSPISAVDESYEAANESPSRAAALDRVGEKRRNARLHPAMQAIFGDGFEVAERSEPFRSGEPTRVAARFCAAEGQSLVEVEHCIERNSLARVTSSRKRTGIPPKSSDTSKAVSIR